MKFIKKEGEIKLRFRSKKKKKIAKIESKNLLIFFQRFPKKNRVQKSSREKKLHEKRIIFCKLQKVWFSWEEKCRIVFQEQRKKWARWTGSCSNMGEHWIDSNQSIGVALGFSSISYQSIVSWCKGGCIQFGLSISTNQHHHQKVLLFVSLIGEKKFIYFFRGFFLYFELSYKLDDVILQCKCWKYK